jgi:hypothetical protein
MKLLKTECLLSLEPGERADLAYALGLVTAYYEQTRPQGDVTGMQYEMQEAFGELEKLWSVIRKS